MDIVIVAQYLRNIENFEGNNSRFIYLAKLLAKNNKVEIITSDFCHGEKRHFSSVGKLQKIKVTVLHELGYPKNVCLKRFGSHRGLAHNIKKYLNNRVKPDVIYVAVPSLDVARECAVYCEQQKVKYIIDIQDLWPEAFQMVFNIPLLSTLVFSPLKIMANKVYQQADEIIAVSDTYVNRAISVNRKCKTGHSVFLGTDLRTFDDNVKDNLIIRKDNEIWLAYCGTLGASYDLSIVFNAMRQIKNINLKFIVMGDGPSRNEFEKKAEGLNVKFTGRLPYPKMCGILKSCDIAVNPIMHGAAQSIINKHADYAASGIPVLNTQESKEYRKLVDEYKMGFNCDSNDANDLARRIQLLCDNKELRVEMGENARRCAQEKFDRRYSYLIIKDVIEENEDSCKN